MIKAYTDIEQSKKLAEILPIKSADMHYVTWTILENDEFEVYVNQTDTIESLQEEYGNQIIPCWSLAALFDVIPKYEIINFGDSIELNVDYDALETESDETLLDLVVNMIIYLHKS